MAQKGKNEDKKQVQEVDNDDEDGQDVEIDDKDKTSKAAAKELGRMSDLIPEKQELDASKVKKAMEALAAAQKANQDAARQREKELAAVKIQKEDVDVIVTEIEVDKKLAERRLREHGGDLAAALRSYLV